MPSCGEALIALLQRAGVTTVFGIPGVHTLELYRGIGASGLRHVAPRHEQGAAFMADGYARVTGRPGVCVLIGGPGLTNAITPIAQAYHDSIPMLVVSGAVPAAQRDLGEIHDLPDQRALLADRHRLQPHRHRSERAGRGHGPGVGGVRFAPAAPGAHRAAARRDQAAGRRRRLDPAGAGAARSQIRRASPAPRRCWPPRTARWSCSAAVPPAPAQKRSPSHARSPRRSA